MHIGPVREFCVIYCDGVIVLRLLVYFETFLSIFINMNVY